MIISGTFLWLALAGGIAAVTNATPTTTPAPELQLAIAYNGAFVALFLDDLVSNNGRYSSYMRAHGMKYPQTLIQYRLDEARETDFFQAMEKFPFSQFQTYITVFPWYTQLLSQALITEFKVPADFTTAVAATSCGSTLGDSPPCRASPTTSALGSPSTTTAGSPALARGAVTAVAALPAVLAAVVLAM